LLQHNPSEKTKHLSLQGVEPCSVRSQIAKSTRQAHEALHVHPVLSRLISPDINADEYRKILVAHLSFYQAAEDARQLFALLPSLSFDPALRSLREDLDDNSVLRTQELPITSRLEALGMLYVLYGSSFGAKVILRNLEATISDKKHVFFSRRVNINAWQTLLGAMEEYHSQQNKISEVALGSEKTFFAFDQRTRAAGASR
jgi:heme oxygenase